MNWTSFFLGASNGIILCWVLYLLRPRPSRHVIYRKGQPPEIVE